MQSIRFHHHHWPGHGARRDYISQDAPEQAIYHCFNGRGGAEVIIVCELILGFVLGADKKRPSSEARP